MERKKELTANQHEELIDLLKSRFEKNRNRHEGLVWENVQTKLESSSEKLWSLNEMERTGGEPDIIGFESITNE